MTNRFTKAHTLAEIYKLAILDKRIQEESSDDEKEDDKSSEDSDISARGYTE